MSRPKTAAQEIVAEGRLDAGLEAVAQSGIAKEAAQGRYKELESGISD